MSRAGEHRETLLAAALDHRRDQQSIQQVLVPSTADDLVEGIHVRIPCVRGRTNPPIGQEAYDIAIVTEFLDREVRHRVEQLRTVRVVGRQ